MTDRPDAWFDEPTPTQTPVPVTPVRTRNRLRLGAIVGLVALALVATAVVAGGRLLQTTTSSTTGLAAWAPTDSLFYVESRFANLPAEQRADLEAFLGHFPLDGSADVEGRIADAFDRLIGGISDDSHDYSTEIKPWITGTVAAAAVTLPTMHLDANLADAPEAILILGITDQAAATRWIDEVVADSGPTWERSTYGGATLLSAFSYSITALDEVLLLGETGLVKAAIDGGGAGGLESVDSFAAAAKTLAPDNLLAWYVDGRRYVDWALSVGDTPSNIGTCAAALTAIPGWVAGSVAADDDAMLAQGAWPHVDAIAPASKNGRSALLSRLPASSLVVADVHELGAAIRRGVDQIRDCDDAGAGFVFDQIDNAIGAVGGWEGLTGAIGETAFVLDRGTDGPVGGIAFIPTDPADAQRLIDQARGPDRARRRRDLARRAVLRRRDDHGRDLGRT